MIDRTLYNQPLVSICIPTYNNARFLRESLDSIVNQTYSNKEIIVSDNASTDGTKEIADEYVKKYGVRYYRNAKTVDMYDNFNRCINLAHGEFVAIYHSDDIYRVNIVEKEANFLQSHSNAGAVFTSGSSINEKGETIGTFNLPKELKGKDIYTFEDIYITLLKYGNILSCPTCMVRKDVHKEVGFYDVRRFGRPADLAMYLKILEKFPIGIIDESLHKYRISKTQGIKQWHYLRTKRNDVFLVMEYFLKSKALQDVSIEKRVLRMYEARKSIEDLYCAMNLLMLGKNSEAKKMILRSFSLDAFKSSFESVKSLEYTIVRLILTVGTCIGLGKYLWRIFYKIKYKMELNEQEIAKFYSNP